MMDVTTGYDGLRNNRHYSPTNTPTPWIVLVGQKLRSFVRDSLFRGNPVTIIQGGDECHKVDPLTGLPLVVNAQTSLLANQDWSPSHVLG
jgi:hypothetical protein